MRTLVWLALVALSAHAAEGASRWTRLRSDHFLFVGDASERSIRDVALHLEQFRDVLSRVLPSSAVTSMVPTIVFVFQNDASFTPYKPTFEGKPVALAGFFSGGADRNVIAINAAAELNALRIIFHEYAHFLVQNTSGRLPPWANEGFAGFYETFQDRSGGKSALIGVPNGDHLALLKSSPFMPLADLLAIGYASPVYNEGNRRGVFYAESWALMHYLQLGSQQRASQLTRYLARLHEGAEPTATFKEVFGDPLILERELRDYVRKFTFTTLRLDFAEKLGGAVAGAADVLDDVNSATYLADLLARSGHVDEARGRLQKILDANPNATAAAEVLGVLELNAGNADKALPWLERAARDPADHAAQVLWGRAALQRYEQEANDGRAPGPGLDNVRTTLAHALQLRPDDAETLATLGRAESVAGEDVVKALMLLERAVALSPGREEYRLMLAEELARQREFARATTILGPLLASGRDADIRDAARRVLTAIASRTNGSARDDAGARAPDPSAGSAGRFVPAFRVLRPEESRVGGMMTAIDCRGGAIEIRVDTENESLRLAASSFNAVDFISYQSSTPQSISCGPVQPPQRVFATYRESDAAVQSTGVDGRAIAIEVLPEGYVVR